MNDEAIPLRRQPWNKGKLIGAKPPLRASNVWSIRTRLQLEERPRDLAPDAAPNVRQGMISAIAAWALDLSAGHPTRHGTIGEFLNGHDFLVTITKVNAMPGEPSGTA
jgi:hypothetical protein